MVTGVSGAGKSSLVFDTIYAEAQRRYLQSFSPYVRQFLERLDKPAADFIGDLPPAIAVRRRSRPRAARATVGTLTEVLDYLGLLFTKRGVVVCVQCGQIVKAQQPADVLAALAAMPSGVRVSIAFPSQPADDGDVSRWLAELREEGFMRLRIGAREVHLGEEEVPAPGPHEKTFVVVDRLLTGQSTPQRLNDSMETAFAAGTAGLLCWLPRRTCCLIGACVCPRCDIPYPEPQPRLFNPNDPLGACPGCHGTGMASKGDGPCTACHGNRFNDVALSLRLDSQNIAELCALSIVELAGFLSRLSAKAPAANGDTADKILLEQLQKRLALLSAVDLGYLTLARSARTLSAGEAGRVQLAAALATTLAQAMYLFDEPTAGLHASEVAGVVAQLHKLRDAGNTVMAIDHNLALVRAADHVIDLGPGAGEEGGRLLYQGPPAELAQCADSVTGEFLKAENVIPVPDRRRALNQGFLRLRGANLHNLQALNVDFPLGVLCVVTGVSGAGKSTLVEEVLYPALMAQKHKTKQSAPAPATVVDGASRINDVVLMDQDPLPRSSRSNPATYLKIFDEIREVFADTSEARIRNFGPGVFSFNQPGGRCEVCGGQGTLTIDMRFLADVTMICPECHGARFKKEVLNVKVRSLSIAEVLNLTVRQAFRFFAPSPRLRSV